MLNENFKEFLLKNMMYNPHMFNQAIDYVLLKKRDFTTIDELIEILKSECGEEVLNYVSFGEGLRTLNFVVSALTKKTQEVNNEEARE